MVLSPPPVRHALHSQRLSQHAIKMPRETRGSDVADDNHVDARRGHLTRQQANKRAIPIKMGSEKIWAQEQVAPWCADGDMNPPVETSMLPHCFLCVDMAAMFMIGN